MTNQSNTMTTYVCGFLFNTQLTRVALILKNRGPRNMVGKYNGLGGKVESGESPRGAMAREFYEEAGLQTSPLDWSCFHTEQYFADTNNKVYFLCATTSDEVLDSCTTMESEQVTIVDIWRDGTLNVGQYAAIYNLRYLIPMAMNWLENPLDRYFEG